jgi:hypothetical protein
MPDLVRTRLLAMIDAELKETMGSISNNKIWMHGSDTQEEASMFEENLAELMELDRILMKLRELVVEDALEL